MPSNPLNIDLGQNSIFLLRLSATRELQKVRGGKIGGESAERIVDFAAKDGLTYAESRFLSGLSRDEFTTRGAQVLDQFVAANPVPPPTDGPERVARTQRAIEKAAANGKISFEDVEAIRDTFNGLESTPETLAQQRAAVQALLDRTDVKFAQRPFILGSEITARALLQGLVSPPQPRASVVPVRP